MLKTTLKVKILGAVIAAGTAVALTYQATKPITGQTAEDRCTQRVKDFVELAGKNKEVAFVFAAVVGLASKLNPTASQEEVMTLVADKIIQACLADETRKQEI